MHSMNPIFAGLFLIAVMTATPGSAQDAVAGSTPSPALSVPPGSAISAPSLAPLGDLAAMTFSCPQAGLNAAAREAAQVPTEGTYQFAYFNIISDAHHAMYDVRFRSNYEGEPMLRYCVELYCQQGWDPRTTKTTVTRLMDMPAAGERKPPAHGAQCETATPAQRRARPR